MILDEPTTGLDPRARRETWGLIERVRDSGVTVLLVTHSMEEAERLCDRIALISAGRVAALGTPEGLIARSGLGQRLRFRTSEPIDAALLRDLPEVEQVDVDGHDVTVRGTTDMVDGVTGALARASVRTIGMRVHQATLDDAFLALTGYPISTDNTVPFTAEEN